MLFTKRFLGAIYMVVTPGAFADMAPTLDVPTLVPIDEVIANIEARPSQLWVHGDNSKQQLVLGWLYNRRGMLGKDQKIELASNWSVLQNPFPEGHPGIFRWISPVVYRGETIGEGLALPPTTPEAKGDLIKAARLYANSAKISESRQARLGQAWCYEQLGKTGEAVKIYRKLFLDSSKAYAKKKKLKKPITDLLYGDEDVRIAIDSGTALLRLLVAMEESSNRKKIEKAVKSLQREPVTTP